MTTTESPGRVTAVSTLEKLSKLSKARITATSPGNRVKLTMTNGRYGVQLRREGFQDLDPRDLAEEVTRAVTGALRGFRQQEQRILSGYRQERTSRPKPVPEPVRERIRKAQEGVAVQTESSTRMVRGRWTATEGLRLKVAAVNDSHREQLAGELSAVLNELSQRFRDEMRETTRKARKGSPTDPKPE